MLLRDICCLITPWKDAFSQKMSDSILLKATVPAFLASEFTELVFFSLPHLLFYFLFIYLFFNFGISSSEMLCVSWTIQRIKSFVLWGMIIISVSWIASLSGLAIYFVGTGADENMELLVQELWEFQDSDSKALNGLQGVSEWGSCKVAQVAHLWNQPWFVAIWGRSHFPSSRVLPSFPTARKDKVTGLMNSMGFSMVGTWTLSKAGSANC